MAKSKKSKTRRSTAGFLGGLRRYIVPVLVGFGAGSAGSLIADRTGVNPMIPGGILGFVAGGPIGALIALALPFLIRSVGTGASQTAQVGQVVWT